MQLKNIKTSSQAQQSVTTEEVGFLLTPSGLCALQVCEGVPIVEVMQRYEESLNALCALLRRMARLSKREALDEASVILAGLSDILISLVEGSPMDGNGYHALAYLSDAAKALVDAAIPLPAEEAEIAAALNAKERRQ